MDCNISGEQLWSWVDRDASELEEHIAVCPVCRKRAEKMREEINMLSSEATAALPLPEKIGPYTVRRLLGEGGQALVYEAEQPSPRRPVALKVLKGGYLLDKDQIRRFRRETQTLARLNHPAIATVYESGRTEEGLYYFAMELVDGQPLHRYVKNNKLKQKEILALFLRIFEAVQYAHDNGVVHRDLKPSNIMIDERGEPRILDFGLARLMYGDEFLSISITKGKKVEGTPRYMSPEQTVGLADGVDSRSDVYTLGVILYELLTGEPPNDVSVFTEEAIRKIREEVPRRPSHRNRSIHRDLEAVILKALEKEPGRRYPSVKEMDDDIRRYLAGEPVRAKSPGFFYGTRTVLGRHRLPIALVGAAVAVVVVAGLWRAADRTGRIRERGRAELLDIRMQLIRDGIDERLYRQGMQATGRYPGLPEAQLVRAQVYFLHREQNMATRILDQCLIDHPDWWPCRLLLAELAGDPASVAGTAARGVWNDKRASSADAWYLRSFATLDLQHAVEYAGEAVARDPDHALSRAFLFGMVETADDPELALSAATRLLEARYTPSVARLKIEVLVRLERFGEALEESDQYIDAKQDYALGYAIRGRVYRLAGDYRRAEADFTRAIELYDNDSSSAGWLYYHRATLYWLLDRYDAAIADYRTCNEEMPFVTFAEARLIILLRETGRRNQAESIFEVARAKGSADQWHMEILDCLAGDIGPDQLIESAQASGRRFKLCEAYYYGGEMLLDAGDIGGAIRMFRNCLATGVKRDPNNVLDAMSEYELANWRITRLILETPPTAFSPKTD